MKKRYSAFTLVELLIVMGVLVVLITIGVAVGRYAIQKSQDVKHRDAAKVLYSGLVKYKGENTKYPEIGNCSGCILREFYSVSLGYTGDESQHILKQYVEEDGAFDGGSDATYYYAVDPDDKQFVVVCVSLGGIDDEAERGFYCTGDGIGILPEENPITDSEIGSQSSGDPLAIVVKSLDSTDWHREDGFSLNN